MMRLLFLIIPFLCCSQSMSTKKSQNYLEYYRLKSEALDHYKSKNFEETFNILSKLYKEYGTDVAIEDSSYEIYVASAEKAKMTYSRYESIKFLIEKCGYNKVVLLSKKRGLKNAFLNSGISDKEYSILKQKYKNGINGDLRKVIKGIRKRDQIYRRGYNKKDKIFKRDSVDQINRRDLKRIFEIYGFPSKALIGSSFYDGEYLYLTFVLRHIPDKELNNYFLPILLSFIVNDGTFTPDLYASIVDIRRGSKRLAPKYSYSKFVDKNIIDKNRYDIGFYPSNNK